MSRESDFGQRMARHYGPETCRLSRKRRVEILNEEILSLRKKIEADRSRDFDLLSRFMARTERDDINILTSFINAEMRDEKYANKARFTKVDYYSHVDGFCGYWQNLRFRLFESVEHKCQECGRREPLEAHHNHYATLGFEDITDLKALCRSCHEREDGVRRSTREFWGNK